jgi:hypothetical protein
MMPFIYPPAALKLESSVGLVYTTRPVQGISRGFFLRLLINYFNYLFNNFDFKKIILIFLDSIILFYFNNFVR